MAEGESSKNIKQGDNKTSDILPPENPEIERVLNNAEDMLKKQAYKNNREDQRLSNMKRFIEKANKK